jgi:hypothetical protein
MKTCPQCHKSFTDASAFCPTCGVQLIEAAQFTCPKCGATIEHGTPFCSQCGTAMNWEQAETANTTAAANLMPANDATAAAPEPQGVDFPKEYHFSSDRGGSTIPIITDIQVDNNYLNVSQYKHFLFFNYSHNMAKIDINDITEVITRKGFTFHSVASFLMAMFFMLVIGSNTWYGWVFWLAIVGYCLYTIKSKYLYIYFPSGYIKIPDDASFSDDLQLLTGYIKKYNPDSIKVVFDQ